MLLNFVVSVILYATALASDPLTELIRIQALQPTVNSRILLSEAYASIRIKRQERYTSFCDRPEELAVLRKPQRG